MERIALALHPVSVQRCSGGVLNLARIMQEIRIRVDWGPEKMP